MNGEIKRLNKVLIDYLFELHHLKKRIKVIKTVIKEEKESSTPQILN